MIFNYSFHFFGYKLFSLNQVSNGELVPSVLKSMYGKDLISENSGLNFLDWSSTFIKGERGDLTLWLLFDFLRVCEWSWGDARLKCFMHAKTSTYFKTVMFHFVARLNTDDEPLHSALAAIPSIFILQIWSAPQVVCKLFNVFLFLHVSSLSEL